MVRKKTSKKATKKYAKQLAKQLAKEVMVKYNKKYNKKLTEEQIRKIFEFVFDELIEQTVDAFIDITEDQIAEQERKDVAKHYEEYMKSIKQGHGVIVVAHSQGNLFVNRVYDQIGILGDINNDEWTKKYFHAIGVATPSSRILDTKYPYKTFDNDIIQLVPSSLKTNVTNPKRYYFGPNAVKERIENTYSLEAHAFLSSYMATEKTRDFILEHISTYLKNHKNEDSLWELKGKSQCSQINGCKGKLQEVKHSKDSSLTKMLKDIKVYPFAKNTLGKLYRAGGEYVKAKCGGRLIEKPENEEKCYELKDEDNKSLGIIKGCKQCKEKKFKSNDIEVFLKWLDPNMNMDLSVDFPNGTYDVKDDICLVEHFHASKDGVGEGLYPVKVTYTLEDENIKPADMTSVFVDIHVPGEKDNRSVTPNTIRNLKNGGHIADIKVSKDKVEFIPTDTYKQNSTVISGGGNYRPPNHTNTIKDKDVYYSDTSSKYNSFGSHSGGQSYNNSWTKPPEEDNYIYTIIWHLSQAVAGPLVGADIILYEASTRKTIFQTKTSFGSNVFGAGIFSLPKEIVNALDDNKLYLIEARGGADIDSDDDGVVDATPTTNYGSLHALMSGYELKMINPKVNMVTNVVYHLAKDKLHSTKEALEKSDEVAYCLLKENINADGVINHIDTLLWVPYKNKSTLRQDHDKEYLKLAKKIHRGEDISQDAYNLYARAWIHNLNISVKEDVAVDSIVGAFKVECDSESKIHTYTLFGHGAEDFYVDNLGNIRVKNRLVYEKKRIYALEVIGENDFGKSPKSKLYITVTADGSPLIGTLSTFAYVSAKAGKELGAFSVNSSNAPITSIVLSGDGSENFTVDKQGNVKVATTAKLQIKTYNLQAVAKNKIGYSAPSSIKIVVYDDKPYVESLHIRVDEKVPTNTKIGGLGYKQGGGAINKFFLEGEGAKNFLLDTNGDIYTKTTLKGGQKYSFTTYATNEFGKSNEARVSIEVIASPAEQQVQICLA